MRMTIQELRKIAAANGLRVWIANGNGRRGKPAYMGDIHIAKLTDEGKRADFYGSRYCDMKRRGYVSDVRYLTAWRGLISANRRAINYVTELSA